MAWLQNLAGKAENLLVKFDENAANVFNDSNLKHLGLDNNNCRSPVIPNLSKGVDNADVSITIDRSTRFISEKSCTSDTEESVVSHNKRETPSPTSNTIDTLLRKEHKGEGSGISSKSGSLQNSFIFMDDTLIKYEDKISKLEQENEEINQQLMNIRHMYCELENENSNLQSQLERTTETLLGTQTEMEQYRARASRILQEKEKLIRLKQNQSCVENNELIFSNYNEELRKELKFQEDKNVELVDKMLKVNNELTVLQQNFILAQTENQTAKQVLQDSLMREKKIRSVAEEECRSKSKELQSRLQEIAHQNSAIASKSQKILQLEAQLKQKYNPSVSSDMEERIQNLTQTLMAKQSNLETITSERNALRLQLEKLESEYRRLMVQSQRNKIRSSHLIDGDEGKTPVPQFFKLSPFDIGVTRKVKRAYSTLDAISIRGGVFLRRYPVARLFVFCYIVMLHVWVLFILCTYIPTTTH
ncbi:hypothetical protein RI129_011621 [Pyrocoelia pectoralis]|uniref:Golgin-84 n=1 Tax=Pyrocoelia pectoralis TaxID=417401 RepID=A0AAN7V334_9COLE